MVLLKGLTRIGIKGDLPPELMFLESFYKTQTLSSKKLQDSSFVDPLPNENIYTKLPELVVYYLNRWTHQNLITTYSQKVRHPNAMANEFEASPQELLESVHHDSVSPFQDLLKP